MSKFIIALTFLTALYISIHFYISSFIARGFSFKYIKYFIIIPGIMSILTLFLRHYIYNSFFEKIYFLSFVWKGFVLILFTYSALGDLTVRFFKFEFRTVVFTVIALSFFSLINSLYSAFKIPDVKYVKIPSCLKGVKGKIAFMSDNHLDFWFKYERFVKTVKKIEKYNPDIIIIGGDLLDPGFDYSRLKNFKFNARVIGILGNHEYYYGVDKSFYYYEKLGIKILYNNSYLFNDFNIMGIADIRTEKLKPGDVLNIIKNNISAGKVNLLVSHQPLYFDEISKKFNIIMLSGHVHKGQIFPFHIFTRLAYRYFYGLYRKNNSYLYVTSGAGTWGPPLRFFADSEIVILELTDEM